MLERCERVYNDYVDLGVLSWYVLTMWLPAERQALAFSAILAGMFFFTVPFSSQRPPVPPCISA
jgi:hypothetical protein